MDEAHDSFNGSVFGSMNTRGKAKNRTIAFPIYEHNRQLDRPGRGLPDVQKTTRYLSWKCSDIANCDFILAHRRRLALGKEHVNKHVLKLWNGRRARGVELLHQSDPAKHNCRPREYDFSGKAGQRRGRRSR
jgi:hypothetical protein